MKLLKRLIVIIIIALIAYISLQVYLYIGGRDIAASNDYTFTYTGGTTMHLNLGTPFERAKVRINDEPVIAEEIKGPDETILSFTLDSIEHDEVLTFEITMLNKDNEEIKKRVLENVCISTGGKVPKHGIKTLVLYNYMGAGFPEFSGDNLESLFVLYTKDATKNIALDALKQNVKLESVYIVSKGAVYGELKTMKPLDNLKRLVISADGNVNGDLDAIDNLLLLETLHLENTQIAGEIKDLTPLENIQNLSLVNNRQISGDIKWLKKLTDLRKLHVEGCSTTGDISSLSDLRLLESVIIK